MNPMDPKNDGVAGAVEKIIDAGRASGKIETLQIAVTDIDRDGQKVRGEVPVIIGTDRDGKTVMMSALEHVKAGTTWIREQRLRAAAGPDRITGTANMQSLASLLEYVGRFQDKDSAVFADAVNRKLVAILDYNRGRRVEDPAALAVEKSDALAGQPRWGGHRAVYACPLSKAWSAWGGDKGREMSQDELAALLDERDMEIGTGALMDGTPSPTPARLLTFARNLEFHSTEEVKRVKDQGGNMRLEFKADNSLTTVDPPTSFLVKIPVFDDSQPLTLEVRLRWTVEKGRGVKFILAIRDAEGVLKRSFEDICQHVRDTLALPVFLGTPEA